MIRTGAPRTWTAVALAWLGAAGSGCSGGGADPSDPSGDALDRDTFVAVYVDLRLAAVDEGDGEAAQARRADILEEHGVDADDLLAFVRLHGDDPAYMREVWDDVAAAMDERTRGPGREPGADSLDGAVEGDAPDGGPAPGADGTGNGTDGNGVDGAGP